jgi:hypothetical protein
MTNTSTGNRILPPGGQFSAVIDGKPTGLAGCKQAATCPRAERCIRADERLPYRAIMALPGTGECRAFIPN